MKDDGISILFELVTIVVPLTAVNKIINCNSLEFKLERN